MEADGQREWLVFLCYRRADGDEVAEALFDLLDGQVLPGVPKGCTSAPTIRVFYDKNAPPVPDWHAYHGPRLVESRHIIYVATPGAANARADRPVDWVRDEITWWIKNKPGSTPFVINPLSEGDPWVPPEIQQTWPRLNRIDFRLHLWNNSFKPEVCEQLKDRARRRILLGILAAAETKTEHIYIESGRLIEELDAANEKLRSAEVTARQTFKAVLGGFAVIIALATVGILALALQYSKTNIARNEAEDRADQLAALAAELGAKKKDLERIRPVASRLESLQADLSSCRELLGEEDATCDRCQTELPELRGRSTTLEEQLASCNTNLQRSVKDVSTYRARFDTAQTQAATDASTIATCTSERSAWAEAQSKTGDALASLSQVIPRLTVQVATLQAQLQDCNTKPPATSDATPKVTPAVVSPVVDQGTDNSGDGGGTDSSQVDTPIPG